MHVDWKFIRRCMLSPLFDVSMALCAQDRRVVLAPVLSSIEVGFVILEWVIYINAGFFHGQEFEAESSREQLRSSRDRKLR